MKNLIIFLLLGITAFSGYAQSGKNKNVTESYCVKFKKDITKDYEHKVAKGKMQSSSANKTLELVDKACTAAIQNNMSVQDFEELFAPVTSADCAFEDDINKLMSEYMPADRAYVLEKLKDICTWAAENGDPKILMMTNVQKRLVELGITE